MKQKVTAVIPSFNGLNLLQKNLPAVLACLNDGDEIVIVDDDSQDQTIAWLTSHFKLQNRVIKLENKRLTLKIGKQLVEQKTIRIVVIVNHRNLRFARSCNRGVSIAQHPLILLLNNDVSPSADILTHLVPYFQQKDVFAVAPLEIEHHQQNKFSGKNLLWFFRGRFIHSAATEFSAGPTAWVSGGSGLFDKEKWQQLNGFDARFSPAYWEDIDLSFRARKRGWQVLFEPKAVVHHNHESTNSQVFTTKELWLMSWQNGELFTRLHARWWQRPLFWLWQPYWWLKKKQHLAQLLVAK